MIISEWDSKLHICDIYITSDDKYQDLFSSFSYWAVNKTNKQTQIQGMPIAFFHTILLVPRRALGRLLICKNICEIIR